MNTDFRHVPVLATEVQNFLLTPKTKSYFEGTLGLGGHLDLAIQNHPQIEWCGATDLDREHIDFSCNRFKSCRIQPELFHKNFSTIPEIFAKISPLRPLSLLLDLGLCSTHVDYPHKGFSWREDVQLDMRYDRQNGQTACDWLAQTPLNNMRKSFRDFGEEPHAAKISHAIIDAREQKSITTTHQLVSIIQSSIPSKFWKKAIIRIFQAIRIVINGELDHLQRFFNHILSVLVPGDRLGVISYHSLEDRLVKQYFKDWSCPVTTPTDKDLHTIVTPALGELITKKPITPSAEEQTRNPRSRSAKFRIFQKNV